MAFTSSESKAISCMRKFAALFARTSKAHHREMMAQFHNEMGRVPYDGDRDLGALILEAEADGLTDKDLRLFLYTEASFRAGWCAQNSSGPGEGLARAKHWDDLKEKLRKLATEAPR